MQGEKVINFMRQNIGALKEIEEIIAHDEKQQTSALNIDEMAQLKNYISTMKSACEATIKLASHYKNEKNPEQKETVSKSSSKPSSSISEGKSKSSKKSQANPGVEEIDDSEFEDLLK